MGGLRVHQYGAIDLSSVYDARSSMFSKRVLIKNRTQHWVSNFCHVPLDPSRTQSIVGTLCVWRKGFFSKIFEGCPGANFKRPLTLPASLVIKIRVSATKCPGDKRQDRGTRLCRLDRACFFANRFASSPHDRKPHNLGKVYASHLPIIMSPGLSLYCSVSILREKKIHAKCALRSILIVTLCYWDSIF